MRKQESKTKKQNIQINNNKGENDMTKQFEQSAETSGTDNDVSKKDTPETKLSEGVTEAPRSPEEMHLKHIRKWPNAVKSYLRVSDDHGELLGSKIRERKAKRFCDKYANTKAADIKDLAKVIAEAKDLAIKYILQINMVESGLAGTICKYRLRGGMVFNIIKKLVKEKYGPVWKEWFAVNFDGREFRTVQDYMRLAKLSGIIRYAVFGKERLIQIDKQLSKAEKKTADPIGDFIRRNGINFNPEEEIDAQELRIETDIAINLQKLIGAGITEITKDRVETLVHNGREVEPAHIRELKVAKDAGLDVVARFEEILASDGKPEPFMTPERKSEGFKKKTDQFIKAMESAISDAEYLGQVNADTIVNLKEKLQQLEQLIQPTA